MSAQAVCGGPANSEFSCCRHVALEVAVNKGYTGFRKPRERQTQINLNQCLPQYLVSLNSFGFFFLKLVAKKSLDYIPFIMNLIK